MMSRRTQAFTLVELLVVIGVITVLIGILLPVLSGVRERGNTIKCASNLKSIGQGFAVYQAQFKGFFPPAYRYLDAQQRETRFEDEPATPVGGYLHWSWYIYDSNRSGRTPKEAFQCPSIDRGGLPPTNPSPENRDPSQDNDPATAPGIVDLQVDRIAYTVNEAIMPRNKFHAGVRDGSEPVVNTLSRLTQIAQIRKPADVILATEFWADYRIVSTITGIDGDPNVCKSHRPVHGFTFRAGGGAVTSINSAAPDPLGRTGPGFCPLGRVTNVPKWVQFGDPQSNRLYWVGRNHGKRSESNPPRTNFLYVDGHVVTKTIEETLKPFEWGEKVYWAPQLSVFVP